MSDNTREPAVRCLARELLEASYTFQDGDGDRAPKYALLPTGQRVNRVLISGVVMRTEDVGNDTEYQMAEIMDAAGDSFYVYAGQYQTEARDTIREVETPEYVSVVGKVKTYETDGETRVKIRPETMQVVDADTRKTWTVDAVQQTVKRVQAFRDEDMDEADITEAKMQYGDDVSLYLEAAIAALENLESEVPIEESDEESADAGEESEAEGSEGLPETIKNADYNALRSVASDVEDVPGSGISEERMQAQLVESLGAETLAEELSAADAESGATASA
jgi:RPA family protein